MNWVRIFNRIFQIIDTKGDTYFSGGKFISKVREVDPYFPNYNQYIEQRHQQGKSTSRKDYYYDILLGFDESNRLRIIQAILDEVKGFEPDKVLKIINEMGWITTIPSPEISKELWNSERLNTYLQEIDIRINSSEYASAVTLSYTCLEGFLKAYIYKNCPNIEVKQEIIALSKAVQGHLRSNLHKYPDEAISMLSHIAHTVDRSRNKFSESHFEEEAGRWLAVFIRDLVNCEIRLLLHVL